jgi:hypothetical protein
MIRDFMGGSGEKRVAGSEKEEGVRGVRGARLRQGYGAARPAAGPQARKTWRRSCLRVKKGVKVRVKGRRKEAVEM